MVDGSLYLGDTSTVIYKNESGNLIMSDSSATSSNVETSVLDTSILDGATVNLDLQNYKSSFVWWITNESTVDLNISNLGPNSLTDITVKKEPAATTDISLGGSGLSFKGYNGINYDVSLLYLDSSNNTNRYFTINIKGTNLIDGSDRICLVALGSNAG